MFLRPHTIRRILYSANEGIASTRLYRKRQSAHKFPCWSGKVGNRPPGGCVGDSRLAPGNAGYDVIRPPSAEYRTLPPGGRQPTQFSQLDNVSTDCASHRPPTSLLTDLPV